MSLTNLLRSKARGASGGASFRPEVERLEQRQVPSRGGSAAWVSGDGVCALFQSGSVWSHSTAYADTNISWAQPTSTNTVAATAVSAGLSYTARRYSPRARAGHAMNQLLTVRPFPCTPRAGHTQGVKP
jgi:hypothetical protein